MGPGLTGAAIKAETGRRLKPHGTASSSGASAWEKAQALP